jgi:hypothetical protein
MLGIVALGLLVLTLLVVASSERAESIVEQIRETDP